MTLYAEQFAVSPMEAAPAPRVTRGGVEKLGVALLFFLVAYLPMEDFVLRFVPVGVVTRGILRLLPEAAIYGMFALLGTMRLVRHSKWVKTPLDGPFVLIVVAWALSFLVNGTSTLPALITLRTLIRFFFAYYIAIWCGVDRRLVYLWMRVVVLIALLQVGLGVAQRVWPEILPFFYPEEVGLEIGGISRNVSILGRGAEFGAVIGTFGWTTYMATFLVLAIAIVASFSRSVVHSYPLPVSFFLLLGVALTYSKASTLLAGGLIVAIAAWHGRFGALAVTGMVLGWVVFAVSAASVGDALESSKKVERTVLEDLALLQNVMDSNPRVWVIVVLGGAVFSLDGLLGFGPDPNQAVQNLLWSGSEFHHLLSFKPWEDVYWVAIGVYFGVLGIAGVGWAILKHGRYGWRLSRSRDPFRRGMGTCMVAIALSLTLLLFVSRVLEFRAFGFALWITLGLGVGLAQSERRRRRRRVPA